MEWLINIFKTVFEISMVASMISAIILTIKYTLGKKLNIGFHQMLWLMILVKFIVPYTPESYLSIMNYLPQLQEQKNTISKSSSNKQMAVDNEEKRNSTFVYEQIEYNRDALLSPTTKAYPQYTQLFQPVNEETAPLHKSPWQRILSMITMIWLIGCVSTILGLGYISYTFQKKMKDYPVQSGYDHIIIRCKKQLGIKQKVKVYSTNDLCPYIVGILRPAISFPETLHKHASEEQLEHILLHELAHYKRGDIFYNFIWSIAIAVHWFNPFIWFIHKQVKLDREIACDAHVLRILGEESAVSYGMTILRMARFLVQGQSPLGVICTFGHKKQLERRIYMINKYNRLSYKAIAVLIAGSLLLGGVLLTKPIQAYNERDEDKVNITSNEVTEATGEKEFEVFTNTRRYSTIEEIQQLVNYDFKIPDKLPDDCGVGSKRYYMTYPFQVGLNFIALHWKRDISFYIAKADISDKLNTLSREPMQIGGIQGEKLVIKDMPSDLGHTIDFFTFKYEKVYYMLELATDGQECVTREEAKMIITSLKKLEDINNVNYSSLSQLGYIYDVVDLQNARNKLGYDFIVPSYNPYFRVRHAYFGEEEIRFSYINNFYYEQSKKKSREYEVYLENRDSEEGVAYYTINDGGLLNDNKAEWKQINGHNVLCVTKTYPEGAYEDYFYMWKVGDIYHTLSIPTSITVPPVFHEEIVVDFMHAKSIDKRYPQ